MSDWAIEIQVPPESRQATASQLVAWTGRAVEERPDGTLVSVVSTEASARRCIALLEQRYHPHPPLEMTCSELDAIDWSERWKDGLGPRRVGRTLIVPTWRRDDVTVAGVRLVLDPGRAFGSGEHGSTRAALRLLERHLSRGHTVLDCGSGSGILTIASVLHGAARAIGIEQDADAVEIAEANARQNGLARQATFIVGDVGTLAPLVAPVDLLVANLLRQRLVPLLPALHRTLQPQGIAIFSGMEISEAAAFTPVLESSGFLPLDEVRDQDWWAVAVERR